jgi:hypothetical protein
MRLSMQFVSGRPLGRGSRTREQRRHYSEGSYRQFPQTSTLGAQSKGDFLPGITPCSDIEAFFNCLAGTCPAEPCPSSADFDGDGDVGTDADIEAFFGVLGGSTC